MYAKVASVLAFAGLSAATPVARQSTIADGTPFGLMALRSGSEIHFAPVDAARSSLFLDLPAQNASCDNGAADSATFYLQDGGLYLYAQSATPQQLYTDRSGMGQGVLQYTTGAEPIAKNGERTNFTLDATGDLTFNGAGFLACPNSIDGAWALWVDVGDATPANQEGCLGFSARAVEVTNPNGCLYTE